MPDADTWEASTYRCQICMQLFSSELTGKMTPLIVCSNIHTVCRGCTSSVRDMPTPKCPQCRTDLWKQDVVNRDLIFFMGRLELACGSCSSTIKMNCATALKHSRECFENHVPCPLLNNDTTLSRCNQSMSISNLWQHCLQYHNDGTTNTTLMVDATETTSNAMSNTSTTATMSVVVSLDKNSYTYFSIRTKFNTYNMCMHITSICHSESEPRNIVFCFRRFFPEVALTFDKMLLSVEIGDLCGMLLKIPTVVSPYEDMSSLNELPRCQRLYKTIEIQPGLLQQMNTDFAGASEVLSSDEGGSISSIAMTISAQFFFREVGEATSTVVDPETSSESESESPVSKRQRTALET